MNQIHTHPSQPEMQAEVILASRAKDCPTLYTIRLRYPRIIHAEIMTHRVFSRNARSSRAVPVRTMLEEVRNTPFVPWHWGKNQKGMQAGEECNATVRVQVRPYDNIQDDGTDEVEREEAWLWARDKAVEAAEAFMTADYHKQIPNRLLEPFAWIDTLITATDWANFLWLRDHKDAEPHLQDLARLVKQAIKEAEVQKLKEGEWHLPYIAAQDWDTAYATTNHVEGLVMEKLLKISAARCARISYKPFDGDASYERELERYDQLVKSDRVHASPLEHQATPDMKITASIDLFEDDNESLTPDETLDAQYVWKHKQLHGNFTGWIQYRKTVPNEAVHG